LSGCPFVGLDTITLDPISEIVGGGFCDATNQDSPKVLAPNLATGQAPVWTANSGRHGNIL
jgi:hypothetical protein